MIPLELELIKIEGAFKTAFDSILKLIMQTENYSKINWDPRAVKIF